MKYILFLVLWFFTFPACSASKAPYMTKLIKVPSDQMAMLTLGEAILYDKANLLSAIRYNLSFLQSPRAREIYKPFKEVGISRHLVAKSLRTFRKLLIKSKSRTELRRQLVRHFSLYRHPNNEGLVRFTGYFQPTYMASRVPTKEYRYPIYQMPPSFHDWPKPHPTRVELEGFEGMGSETGLLDGYELAWLKSRYKAFMIHVQGSAILQLTDGTQMSVGFAAGTDSPFRGISKKFLRDNNVSWTALPEYFDSHPDQLNTCLARNNRFIFFKENPTPHPIGNLGVPVIAEHSIATDKKYVPPGALSLIKTSMPYGKADGRIRLKRTTRIVLDQDAGSAIKGPRRVDIFMGTGPEAQRKANHIYSKGDLYFLVAKNLVSGSSQRPRYPRGSRT